MKTRIVGIIPARYASTRFPGKPLVKLLNKPMILWVAELSSKAIGKENIFVATEDKRIESVVEEAGFKVIMTSDKHPTGTDRLAEVAKKVDADIYINIQGDEPTLNPEDILKIIKIKQDYPQFVINAMTKLALDKDANNINIPKVIVNENNDMVYMSRLAIPGFKSSINKPNHYYKQVCIYAFNEEQLTKFGNFGRKSILENSEDIEILRFLELGVNVKMIEVENNSYAVDVVSDIEIVENRLKEMNNSL